jgi:hypothetical protein
LLYLQYTSGSTAIPRGIMLSHTNVLDNLGYLSQGFDCAADNRVEDQTQAMLWGLVRTLALAFPRLWGGLLDLPAEAPDARQAAVCTFLYDSGEDSQRALRSRRFLAPRLRPCRYEESQALAIRPDASYQITRCFGSLGRQIARWLCEQGVRNLWLLGRRGATGIKACAYVGVATLEWPDLATILSAKTRGARALQQCTAELSLDFFLNSSSIAALWGSQRQAHYSATNAFLDGLAAYRRSRGQAATGVNWGPLSASAMLTEAAAAELQSYGLRPTPIARATADLMPLLGSSAAQAAAIAVDWARFPPFYQSRCATGLFNELPLGVSEPATSTPVAPVETDTPSDSPATLRAWLIGQLSAPLRLPPHSLGTDLPLPRLGLDSLIAVELRNRLQQRLGHTVPLPDLFGDLTLNGLVAKLTAAPAMPAMELTQAATQEQWITGEI